MLSNTSSPLRAAFLFLLVFTLSACALTSDGLDDPTKTPAVSVPPTEVVVAPTLAPTEPQPTAAPTQPALSIGFVGHLAQAPVGSVTAYGLQAAQVAASAHSAQLNTFDFDTDATLIRAAAEQGNAIVIVAGNDLAERTRAVAEDFPETQFIGIDQPQTDSPANYVVIGDPGNRLDEEGFLAGALAGLITQQRKIGLMVMADSLAGKLYRNGFVHGLRYTCGDCELTAVEIGDANDLARGEKIAADFKSAQIDVMFAAAGPAGEAGLASASTQGMWVIGLGRDLTADANGNPFGLGSVVRRPDIVLPNLISALLAGENPQSIPFSLANGTLAFADTFGPDVSPAVTNYLRDMITQLATGSLDTGIDLTTGAEK
jgi:basic membrane lipoprotein Med (substrate-binding protein (PBP1-ABC) superfamily)